ncbi:hypothetical protein RHO12_12620 (plasmid) [Orbus sturtevantii]|uniref:hypothetical protein n=1 Tax=Orbus sturtevantii TaxID=3074109 RepID=UPI00370D5137
MQKIGSITSSATASGEFTDGVVAAGIEPTILPAAWFNTIQRELVNIIVSSGMTLDPNDDTQIAQAIRGLTNSSVGKFELSMKRLYQLDNGWYSLNGDTFLVSSPQGKVLNSFSTEFKADWGISISGDRINLPNFFSKDGRGAFLRVVNGSSRQVGSWEDDKIRNIWGNVYSFNKGAYIESASQGALYISSTWNSSIKSGSGDNWGGIISMDASRVVPTGIENNPVNLGLTAAMYLGV